MSQDPTPSPSQPSQGTGAVPHAGQAPASAPHQPPASPAAPAGPAYTPAPGYGATNDGTAAYQPYPGYPAGAGYAPAPQAPVKSKTAPIIVLVVGVVLVIGSIIGFTVSLVTVGGTGLHLDTVTVGQPTTIQVASDEVVTLTSSSARTQCTVKDPSGSTVSLQTGDLDDAGIASDDEAFIGTFQAKSAGAYTVDCTGPSSADVTATRITLDDSTIAGGIGILVTMLLGFLGTVMAIAGLVWLIVRVSRNRKAQQAYQQGYPRSW